MSLALALLLLMGAIAMVPPTEAASPLYLNIEGRNTVAIRETNPYIATAIGGPGEAAVGGNYSFLVTVTGQDVTDALVSPGNGITKTGMFRFNLTAPSKAADMTITVNVTSIGPTGEQERLTRTFYVRSVYPITMSARVVNEGAMALSAVPVYFYADGKLLHVQLINLPASGSKVVTYNWTDSVSQGEHQLIMELDPNGKFVRFESGGTVYTQTIWVGGTDYGNTDAILIGAFAILLFVSYLVYKRPVAKRRKK